MIIHIRVIYVVEFVYNNYNKEIHESVCVFYMALK